MRNPLCGFLKLCGSRQCLVQAQTLVCCFAKIKKRSCILCEMEYRIFFGDRIFFDTYLLLQNLSQDTGNDSNDTEWKVCRIKGTKYQDTVSDTGQQLNISRNCSCG